MKGIKANSSEIRHKDKTLDKILDNIKPDGSVIASKTQLGNVKIGDNINVTDDGVISISLATTAKPGVIKVAPSILQNNTIPNIIYIATDFSSQYNGQLLVRRADGTTYGVVHTQISKSPTDQKCISIENGELYVKQATADKFGVVKIGDGLGVDDGVIHSNQLSKNIIIYATANEFQQGISEYYNNHPLELAAVFNKNPEIYNNVDEMLLEVAGDDDYLNIYVQIRYINSTNHDNFDIISGMLTTDIRYVDGTVDSYSIHIGNTNIAEM